MPMITWDPGKTPASTMSSSSLRRHLLFWRKAAAEAKELHLHTCNGRGRAAEAQLHLHTCNGKMLITNTIRRKSNFRSMLKTVWYLLAILSHFRIFFGYFFIHTVLEVLAAPETSQSDQPAAPIAGKTVVDPENPSNTLAEIKIYEQPRKSTTSASRTSSTERSIPHADAAVEHEQQIQQLSAKNNMKPPISSTELLHQLQQENLRALEAKEVIKSNGIVHYEEDEEEGEAHNILATGDNSFGQRSSSIRINHNTGQSRNLGVITITPPFLVFTTNSLSDLGIKLYAGQKYAVTIQLNEQNWPYDTARMMLVSSEISQQLATLGSCPLYQFGDSYSPYDGTAVIPAAADDVMQGRWTFDPVGATIRHGGMFKICVSPGGDFNSFGTLVNIDADGNAVGYQAAGLTDTCTTPGCFANRRFYCWAVNSALMLYAPSGYDCLLYFEGVSYQQGQPQTIVGRVQHMKLSWGVTTADTQISNGEQVGGCPMSLPGTKIKDISYRALELPANTNYTTDVSEQVKTEINYNLGPAQTILPAGFKYSLCFCPDFPGIAFGMCMKPNYYIQDVGKVHFMMWSHGVSRPVYQQRETIIFGTEFDGIIDCGEEECDDKGRIKLVPQNNALLNIPHWQSEGTGCNIASQSEFYFTPPNCDATSGSTFTTVDEFRRTSEQGPDSANFNTMLKDPQQGFQMQRCDLVPDSTTIGRLGFQKMFISQKMHNDFPVGLILDVCFSHNPIYNATVINPDYKIPKSSVALQNVTTTFFKLGELHIHPVMIDFPTEFLALESPATLTVQSAWLGTSNNFPEPNENYYDSLDPNTTDTDYISHLLPLVEFPTLKILWDYDRKFGSKECFEYQQWPWKQDTDLLAARFRALTLNDTISYSFVQNSGNAELQRGFPHQLAEPFGYFEGIWCKDNNTNCTLKGVRTTAGDLLFGNLQRKIQVMPKVAGSFAVCYCSQRCNQDSAYWVLADRLTVAGPYMDPAGNVYRLTSRVQGAFTVPGFGFKTTNRLKIIPQEDSCFQTENITLTPTLNQCLVGIGCRPHDMPYGDDTVMPDLFPTILNDATWAPNNRYITQFQRVVADPVNAPTVGSTWVTFTGVHLLKPGDVIHFDDLIPTADHPMKVTDLMRMIRAKNVGHKILEVETLRARIALDLKGFDDSFPNNDYPTINFASGKWRRTNVLEIPFLFSPVGITGLKLCWSDGEVQPGSALQEVLYKKEAGVFFVDPPPPLGGISMELTSTLMAVPAPVIITFKTSSTTYFESVKNEMRLRLAVPYINRIEMWSSDGSHKIERDLDKNEIHERDQGTCGYILREVWSNDTSIADEYNAVGTKYEKRDLEAGTFPVPQGCYYDIANEQFELIVVLEKGNGLKKDTEYQIVVFARMLRQDAVFQVTIFGDMETDFSRVVELEDVFLPKPLQSWNMSEPFCYTGQWDCELGGSLTNQQYSRRGILHPTRGMMVYAEESHEVGRNQSFMFLLQSESKNSVIIGEQIVRIFMWPLTHWRLPDTTTCASKCFKQIGAQDYADGLPRDCAQFQPQCEMIPLNENCTDTQVRILGTLIDEDWRDSRNANHTCNFYKENSYKELDPDTGLVRIGGMCLTDGGLYPYKNKVANQVCCACNGGSRYEIKKAMKIYLPAGMEKKSRIRGYDEQNMFHVSWSHRQPEGFFNTRWGVQLTDRNDSFPSYTVTSGAYLFQSPDYVTLNTVTAAIVNKRGYVDPFPFAEAKGNAFYLRFVLPYSLSPSTVWKLNLPVGYKCNSLSPVANDFPYINDTSTGHVRYNGQVGAEMITYDKNKCIITLDSRSRFYQKQRFWFYLQVDNPADPLSKYDSTNFWEWEITSAGDMVNGITPDEYKVQSLQNGGLGVPAEFNEMLAETTRLGANYYAPPLFVDPNNYMFHVYPFAPIMSERNSWPLNPSRNSSKVMQSLISPVEQPHSLQDVVILGEPYRLVLPNDYLWTRNFTVLGTLVQRSALLQPVHLQFNKQTVFQVFFKLNRKQTVPNGGLRLDFPDGFLVMEVCYTFDIPEMYSRHVYQQMYSTVFEPTYSVGQILSCRGSYKIPRMDQNPKVPHFDRATILLGDPLLIGYTYAFEIVITPPTYDYYQTYLKPTIDASLSNPNGNKYVFSLSTLSPVGEALEMTYSTLAFNPMEYIYETPTEQDPSTGTHDSFPLHQFELIHPDYILHDPRPYSLTKTPTPITIHNLVLGGLSGILKVTAPIGYVWDWEAAKLNSYWTQWELSLEPYLNKPYTTEIAKNSTEYYSTNLTVNGTFEDCPVPITPTGQFNKRDSNVLLFNDPGCKWENGKVFAFRTWIQVPDYNPVTSTTRWYVEIVNATEPGSLASANDGSIVRPHDNVRSSDVYATMLAKDVAVIRNFAVSMDNVMPYGFGNLTFEFELTQSLPINGTIEIDSPYTFNFTQFYPFDGYDERLNPKLAEEPMCKVFNMSTLKTPEQIAAEQVVYEDPDVQALSDLSTNGTRYLPENNPMPIDIVCRTVYYWETQVVDLEAKFLFSGVNRAILSSPKVGRFLKGKYRLALEVRNPGPDPVLNSVDNNMPCGYRNCFTIISMFRNIRVLEESKRIFEDDPSSFHSTPFMWLKIAEPYPLEIPGSADIPWINYGDNVFLASYLQNPANPNALTGFDPYKAYLTGTSRWLSLSDRIVEYQYEKFASVRMPEIRYAMKSFQIVETTDFDEIRATGRCDRPGCKNSIILVFHLAGWATPGLIYNWELIYQANETTGGAVITDEDIRDITLCPNCTYPGTVIVDTKPDDQPPRFPGGVMRVIAPRGFEFTLDCVTHTNYTYDLFPGLGDDYWKHHAMLKDAEEWPVGHDYKCFGEDNILYLDTDNATFAPAQKYALRIDIEKNPPGILTKSANMWGLRFMQQSAGAQGFEAWSWRKLEVTPISTTIGGPDATPVAITFSPWTALRGKATFPQIVRTVSNYEKSNHTHDHLNDTYHEHEVLVSQTTTVTTEPYYGRVRIFAPQGFFFEIIDYTTYACRFEIIRTDDCLTCGVPFITDSTHNTGEVKQNATICQVGNPKYNEAVITFTGLDGFKGKAMYHYSITLFIFNPRILTLKPVPWRFVTDVMDVPLRAKFGYDHWMEFDETFFGGYNIQLPAPLFQVQVPADKRGAILQTSDQLIRFRFTDPVKLNDRIIIQAPADYYFEDMSLPVRGKCLGFRYDPAVMKFNDTANTTAPEDEPENLALDPDIRLQYEGIGFRMKLTKNDSCVTVDSNNFLRITDASKVTQVMLWNPMPPGLYHFDELRDPLMERPIATLQDDARAAVFDKKQGESNAEYLVRSQSFRISPHLQNLYGKRYADFLQVQEINMTANWTKKTRYPLIQMYSQWTNLTRYECPVEDINNRVYYDEYGNLIPTTTTTVPPQAITGSAVVGIDLDQDPSAIYNDPTLSYSRDFEYTDLLAQKMPETIDFEGFKYGNVHRRPIISDVFGLDKFNLFHQPNQIYSEVDKDVRFCMLLKMPIAYEDTPTVNAMVDYGRNLMREIMHYREKIYTRRYLGTTLENFIVKDQNLNLNQTQYPAHCRALVEEAKEKEYQALLDYWMNDVNTTTTTSTTVNITAMVIAGQLDASALTSTTTTTTTTVYGDECGLSKWHEMPDVGRELALLNQIDTSGKGQHGPEILELLEKQRLMLKLGQYVEPVTTTQPPQQSSSSDTTTTTPEPPGLITDDKHELQIIILHPYCSDVHVTNRSMLSCNTRFEANPRFTFENQTTEYTDSEQLFPIYKADEYEDWQRGYYGDSVCSNMILNSEGQGAATGSPFGNGTYDFYETGENLDFGGNETVLWDQVYGSNPFYLYRPPDPIVGGDGASDNGMSGLLTDGNSTNDSNGTDDLTTNPPIIDPLSLIVYPPDDPETFYNIENRPTWWKQAKGAPDYLFFRARFVFLTNVSMSESEATAQRLKQFVIRQDPVCFNNQLRWERIAELHPRVDLDIGYLGELGVFVRYRNAARRPYGFENYWFATHFKGTEDRFGNFAFTKQSEKAVASWDIETQMFAVRIDFIAGTIANATMLVQFTLQGECDSISIKAVEPDGFRFDKATVESLGTPIDPEEYLKRRMDVDSPDEGGIEDCVEEGSSQDVKSGAAAAASTPGQPSSQADILDTTVTSSTPADFDIGAVQLDPLVWKQDLAQQRGMWTGGDGVFHKVENQKTSGGTTGTSGTSANKMMNNAKCRKNRSVRRGLLAPSDDQEEEDYFLLSEQNRKLYTSFGENSREATEQEVSSQTQSFRRALESVDGDNSFREAEALSALGFYQDAVKGTDIFTVDGSSTAEQPSYDPSPRRGRFLRPVQQPGDDSLRVGAAAATGIETSVEGKAKSALRRLGEDEHGRVTDWRFVSLAETFRDFEFVSAAETDIDSERTENNSKEKQDHGSKNEKKSKSTSSQDLVEEGDLLLSPQSRRTLQTVRPPNPFCDGPPPAGDCTIPLTDEDKCTFYNNLFQSTVAVSTDTTFDPNFQSRGFTQVDTSVEFGFKNELKLKMNAPKGKLIKLIIRNVELPVTGGETLFDLTTFFRGQIQDQSLSCCRPGGTVNPSTPLISFRIARALPIFMAANKNEFRNDPDRYPVEADLPIRFGDNSFIEFKFIASGPVAPGNVLEIQGPAGYRFVPDFFQLRDMGPEGFCPPPKPGDEGCAYPYLSLTVNRILDNGMDQPRLILTMDTKDEIWLKMYRTINMVTVEKKEYDATDPANVYLLERGLIGDDLVVDVNATEVTNVLPPPSSMPDNQIYFGRRYALQARVQGPQQAAPPPNHQFQIKFTTLVAVNNGEYPNDLGPSPDFNMTHCIPFRISKSILAFHDPDITYPLEWQSFVAADSFLDVKLEFPRKFPQDLGLTNLEVYPPSSGFFLPRGQIFSDRQEYLPLQFASITVNKIRPFTAPVEINGTTLYPATKYVQAPGGVNLKLVCDRNDSTPINKDVEPVQNYHWYIIGNAKNPTTGVVSTLGWERYEPKDLLVSQFPVQWNPETKWIAGSQVEAMFEIKFRIPLPVGGAIYIKAPPNYRFRCPITNIMVPEPSYMPICVFNPIHPLLQGCGRIERDLQQVTFDINRLENRIEYLKELSKIKPQEMTPQQRLTFISETVNGTRRELDVKMLYKRELEEIMEYVPPPSSETDSTTITTLTITSTASGGFSITNTPPTTTTTEPPTTLPPNGLATTAKPEGKPPSGCELRHEVLFAYQTTDYPPVFYETKMTRSIRDPITGIRQERSQQVAIPIMTYKFNIRMELPEADAQLPNSNRYNDFDVIMLDRMKRTIDNNVAVPVPQFYTDYKVTNFTFWYDHERTRFRTQEENKVINGIDEAYDPRGKIIPFYVTIAINERIPAGRGFKVMEFTVPDNGFGMEIALPTDVQVLSEAVPVRSWGWDPNSARIKQLFFNMPDIDDIDYNGIPAGQFAFSIPMKLPDTTEAIYGLQGNNIQEFTSQDRNGEYMNFFKVKFCNDFPFCIEKLAEFKVPGFQFNDVTRDDFIVQPDGFGSEKYSRTTDRVVKTLADFQVDEGPQSSGATSRRGIKWSSISGILAGGGIWWLGTTLMVALSYSHHVHAVA